MIRDFDAEQLDAGLLVPHFLMCSYLYYELDISPIPDEQFDRMAKRLLNLWDTVEHRHKHLITREDLAAGTGFAIKDYPTIVQFAAIRWYNDAQNNRRHRSRR